MSGSHDRQLAWGERTALRMHWLICRNCRCFRRQLEFLRLALRRLGQDTWPPAGAALRPESRRRIHEVLIRQMSR